MIWFKDNREHKAGCEFNLQVFKNGETLTDGFLL